MAGVLPQGISAWTLKYMDWVKKGVMFGPDAQKAVLLDYITEVDHARDRIERLDKAIDDAAAAAPERMRAVIDALQALRGIAKVSAVTIVAEVGEVSRFCPPPPAHGLQRRSLERTFQRHENPPRRHHPSRQQSSSQDR